MNDPRTKVMTLEQAVEARLKLAAAGQRLAITNGCFDLLHRGHAEYLMQARSLADRLFVLINSDASVRALKGPSRPVNKGNDRAFLLACLESVDGVIVFRSSRCNKELAALKPDVYVKGGDYTVDSLDPDERAALLGAGSEIRFIPFVHGFSSSGTMKNEREQYILFFKTIDDDLKKNMLYISDSFDLIRKYNSNQCTQKNREDRLLKNIQSALDRMQAQHKQFIEERIIQLKPVQFSKEKVLLKRIQTAWNKFQNQRKEYDKDQLNHIQSELKKVRLKRIQLALNKAAEKGA